jgi:hypothetical protein
VSVCGTCGVEIAEARNGHLVHIDNIPRGFDIFHEVTALPEEEWRTLRGRPSLKGAAEDMLVHHVTGHPESDCAFAQNLRRALDMG